MVMGDCTFAFLLTGDGDSPLLPSSVRSRWWGEDTVTWTEGEKG